MKINKVSLFNIGAYAELNVFEINNNDNNIILIGGKNGAGKSTFFKAIKTCLYGCKIWGFEANCRQYFDIINKLINNDAKLKNEATGYIEIDILFEDGKNDDVYTIKREWIKKKKSISENHIVFKNGVILLNAEKNDFDNYLLSIIPPEMFKFYFFDGEELSDFFLGSKGAQNFRDAFLKLYGLDTITIMLENFRRNVNGGKDKSIYEEYNNSKAEYLEQKKEKSQLLKKIDKLEEDIDNLNSKQKSIIDDFKRFGGISLDTWNSLNKKLDYEDLVRTENAKKIKEIANNFIPFLILHNELIELENKIEQYIIHNKMQIFKEIVKEDKFINYLKQNKISEIEIIQNYVKNSTNAGNIFDFSSSEYKKINYQLNEKLRFDKQELFNLLDDTERSLNETKKIRNILNNSSIDGIQTITNEINKLEIVKLGKEKKVLELKNKVDKVNLILEEKNKHYLKNKDNIKTALKKESVSDISETALIAFELLEEKLIKRQSEILAKEFIAIFNKIINKKNFIDGIAVDYNINVIPYKIIYLNKEKLQNYISDEYNINFLNLFNDNYKVKINSILNGNIEKGKFPVPITSPFSEGEKQIYIMSLYLALLKTSKRNIPFFVDTPFARIDSTNKMAIIDVFFKSIENQIFILSTDSEIYGKYKLLIDDKLNKTFLLKSTRYGVTEIFDNEYFEGE